LQALIYFFVELCLLRKGPQDLPASSALFGLALGADLVVGVIIALSAGISAGIGLTRGGVEIALMLMLLYLALHFTGRLPRFTQTATALLGAGALIGLAAALPVAMLPAAGEGEPQPALAVLLFLGLIVWSVLVTGHILRHTFGLTLGQGAVIALAYDLLAYNLTGALFSVP
jgi:hypothetical protein